MDAALPLVRTPGPKASIGSERRRKARQRWRLGVMLGLAMLLGAILADQFVGLWQHKMIDEKLAQHSKLERMVLHYLRADIVDVAHTPDGRYRVTLYMENVYPEYDMYVMVPQIRVFAQSGPMWREVPVREPSDTRWRAGSVVHLKERITFERVFDVPKDGDWYELLPGFFHVRFENTMLVSPLAQPKDDLVERSDNYYIHLLPAGANIDEVRKRNQFPNGVVPSYLPMPPH